MFACALRNVGDSGLATVRVIREALTVYQHLAAAGAGNITHCTLSDVEMVKHEERRQVSQLHGAY